MNVPSKSRPTASRATTPLFAGEGASAGGRDAMTVTAWVARVNGALKAALPPSWVRGEIGEWKVWASGHAYFSLKDESATVAAMMWSDQVRRLPFRPEPGTVVLALGAPNVYPPSGRLSFVATELEPAGVGALRVAYEQLKRKLQEEGLFDPARKRPLPALPRRIGVVTSRHGAALRDVLKVLSRRFPNAHVTVYPVTVQGERAPEEIAAAVAAFSRHRGADVLIVARGGGSKEDLAAFDDEKVVRAVAASEVPTISAVGHEVDVTLTDFAADVRAATPSQAAELVVARREELQGLLARGEKELVSALGARLADARTELLSLSGEEALAGFASRVQHASREAGGLSRALLSAVRGLPSLYGERLAWAEGRLRSWPDRAALPRRGEAVESERRTLVDRLTARLLRASEALAERASRLSALDPLQVLSRGYAVVSRAGQLVPITDASSTSPGDRLRVLLARGELLAEVREVVPGGDRRGPGGTDVV